MVKELTKGQELELENIQLKGRIKALEHKLEQVTFENVELKVFIETSKKRSKGRKAARIDMSSSFNSELIND